MGSFLSCENVRMLQEGVAPRTSTLQYRGGDWCPHLGFRKKNCADINLLAGAPFSRIQNNQESLIR
jgi:hypothetical protein